VIQVPLTNKIANASLSGSTALADNWYTAGTISGLSLEEGVQTFTTANANYQGIRNGSGYNIPIPAGHKVYIRGYLKSALTSATMWCLSNRHGASAEPTRRDNYTIGSIGDGYADSFKMLSVIPATSSFDYAIYVRPGNSGSGNPDLFSIAFTKPVFVDLTEAFGEGREPTKDWCDANIPFFEESGALTIFEAIKDLDISLTPNVVNVGATFKMSVGMGIPELVTAKVISPISGACISGQAFCLNGFIEIAI
jgi:hypothetical protein